MRLPSALLPCVWSKAGCCQWISRRRQGPSGLRWGCLAAGIIAPFTRAAAASTAPCPSLVLRRREVAQAVRQEGLEERLPAQEQAGLPAGEHFRVPEQEDLLV